MKKKKLWLILIPAILSVFMVCWFYQGEIAYNNKDTESIIITPDSIEYNVDPESEYGQIIYYSYYVERELVSSEFKIRKGSTYITLSNHLEVNYLKSDPSIHQLKITGTGNWIK
jgi:uncharacterized membrane protein